MAWHPTLPLAALRFDPGACVQVVGRELALFRDGERLFALDNSCPHAGGPLAEGSQQDGHVVCPWHGWRFELASGTCTTVAADSTRAYAVRERDGVIEIDLP